MSRPSVILYPFLQEIVYHQSKQDANTFLESAIL